MNEAIEIFRNYPLLLSNHNYTKWNGYISPMKEREILVSILCPNFPSLEESSVNLPSSLETISLAHSNNIREVIESSATFLEFLNRLSSLFATLLPCESSSVNSTGGDISSKSKFFELANEVLTEITDKIGPDNVLSLSGDLTMISLLKTDDCEREHSLELKIPADYPKHSPEILSADLPEVVLSQFSELSTIGDFYKTFSSVVDSLQDFWNMCADLHSNANVTEPRVPMYKDTSRRIAITKDVFAHLILNPVDFRTCPVIRIVGSRKGSSEFQTVFEKNLRELNWDCDRNLLDNLGRMLEVSSFPPPIEEEDDKPSCSQLFQAQECCICFTSRSEDNSAPHKYCNNEKCSSYFHFRCLLEWFQALPNNDTDPNYISGDCLNCGSKILCPIQSA